MFDRDSSSIAAVRRGRSAWLRRVSAPSALCSILALGPWSALAVGCGSNATDTSKSTPAGSAASTTTATTTTTTATAPAVLLSRKADEKAPDVFRARFTTSKGDIVMEAHREWSPAGADRFYTLVKIGFYDGVKFFRVVDGFMAQFGIHGTPAVMNVWRNASIPDDKPVQSNGRGFVTFAMGGPNSRTTQIFINLVDNSRLDKMGFAPFAQVVEGMNVVDALYKGYGEGAPQGRGPDQTRLQMQGNAYLDKSFPELDAVLVAKIDP